MRRLVYAPKAYIFIRSSNLDNQIFDVSSDVVRGEVTQNLGDVSKATFTLRNRYQKWLRRDTDGRTIFLPMDLVTIWLQRVAGRPVQVFTGYLDAVPYYQAYPNNVVFRATCTLKKLAFTWFDPGLEAFTQWIATTPGWIFNPTTGQGFNPEAVVNGTTVTAQNPGTGQSMNDGGFGTLLGRFMTEVAGWSADDVLISNLPKDLPKAAAKLWNLINSEAQADVQKLEDFLSTQMSVSGWSQTSASTPTTDTGKATQSTAAQATVARIGTVASQQNVPTIVPVLAASLQTGFNESYSKAPDSTGAAPWGQGIYALRPTKTISSSAAAVSSDAAPTARIDGRAPTDLMSLEVSTEVFCRRLQANQGPWVAAARNGDLNAMMIWITKALGYTPNTPANLLDIYNQTKQLCAVTMVTTPPSAFPVVSGSQDAITFSSPQVQAVLSPSEQVVAAVNYSVSQPWLAAHVISAKSVSPDIRLVAPPTKDNTTISFAGPTEDVAAYFKTLRGNSQIDAATLSVAGSDPQYLKQGVPSNVPNDNAPSPAASSQGQHVTITQAKAGASATDGGGDGSTSAGGSTTTTATALDPSLFPILATFSADASFAANFAFPTDVVESRLLTGNKALMNDISCLDGVKQFCQASLRTFRSLPDGRFLAFYPDYFGSHRQPYWSIYNIELTQFDIELNDDSLATHVFVVGDTTPAAPGNNEISVIDEVQTRGVATITQAFMLNSFIVPVNQTQSNSPIGRLAEAYDFLKHYGARPHKEEMPLIRNVFYEFLLAWQKFMYLWSQQFASTVTFTYQPEVMAGGLIAFPDHDVQMFCEQVTHVFDYEAGFSTSGTMTAPSLLTKTNVPLNSMPGFALAGGINTVGAE